MITYIIQQLFYTIGETNIDNSENDGIIMLTKNRKDFIFMNNDVRLIFNEYEFRREQVITDNYAETLLDMAFTTNYIAGEYYGVMAFVQFTYKTGNTYDIKIVSENFLQITPRNSTLISSFQDKIRCRTTPFSIKLLRKGNEMGYQISISNVREGDGQRIFKFMTDTALNDFKEMEKISHAGF